MQGKRNRRAAPIADRFWPKVNKDGPTIRPELGPCWIWTASLGSSGYGQIGQGRRGLRPIGAHRVGYELAYGPIPEGMHVCHRCDNCVCVRPDHLFLGSRSDNVRDMYGKGRSGSQTRPERLARGDQSGVSKLTSADVMAIRADFKRGQPNTELAARFSVSLSTVRKVAYGVTWQHLL